MDYKQMTNEIANPFAFDSEASPPVAQCVRMRRTSAHSCVLCCHWSRQSQAAAL